MMSKFGFADTLNPKGFRLLNLPTPTPRSNSFSTGKSIFKTLCHNVVLSQVVVQPIVMLIFKKP